MSDRVSRSSQTREKKSRRKPWQPPSRLDAPAPPDGYRHRWIRTALRGDDDKMNVHAKLREGWEPVRADEYPGFDYATIEDGKYEGVIGNGGLMLARLPEETALERTDYYRGRTREQMTAVDQDLMKDQHPSMPISNSRQSRVTFGGRGSDSSE
ncbi:MAG: hypothetical protein CBC65_010430 [Rhodothermaceae bacterium TMED105]|jgi:hypothetical protein|nr:MAG: hypothetical protein CBC65_010430 [Rhodothermaceae bacterium TMED105]|tara:strand:- start:620 stop:1081 length:462 start_codon:yes stop_codon:yes gene_type:complete